ncbi:MAG: tetratricopeptide repeat protein, partial [Candidatus Sumerlaeota bacterium]|nr:tetratricopeptide repeat protein [Candidatus Sumerlaeota bacterium]
IFGFTLTDSLSRLTRQGNHAFEEGKLERALELYKNAQVESPESPELHFNIGNVLLKNKKYEEAIKEFEQAAALLKEPSRMADAHYNIGVAQYRMAEQLITAQNLPEAAKKLEECMASNQQAMKRNAKDADPKYNYEQAKRLWKEILDKMKEQQKNQEQKQQEQQKNEGEKKEGEQKEKQSQKNEQKKEEQAKAQEQKQEEKKEEQGQKEKETKEEQQAQQQETKVGEMSKDDALRLLSTLPQENRESLKEALKHQYQGRMAPEKDW